jgi:RNA-directed DNA polymerase
LDELVQRIRSWEAHLLHGDIYRLRRKLFDHYVFVKGETAYIRLLAREERIQAYEED